MLMLFLSPSPPLSPLSLFPSLSLFSPLSLSLISLITFFEYILLHFPMTYDDFHVLTLPTFLMVIFL